MPTCPSGSTLKPGFAGFVHVDPAYLDYLLPLPLAWLKPFLPYMQPVDVDVSALCSAEPPDWPSLDASDLINLIRPTKAGIAVQVGFKVAQLVHVLIWYAACQCNAPDPAPVLPTPPALPTGAPAVNPPNLVLPPATGPCYEFTNGTVVYVANNSLSRGAWLVTNLGSPATSATFHITSVRVTAPGPALTITLQMVDEFTSTNIQTYTWTLAPGVSREVTVPVPPMTTAIYYVVQASAAAGSTSEQATIKVYCAGAQPGRQSECCSDLRAIGMLEQIYGLLTSVQRNYAPFAYIRGASHSGVSGTGSIAVSRLIGLDVQVVSWPADKRVAFGNPPYIKDLGWLSVSEADGMIQERRLAQQDLTWFPQLAPVATQINYALQDGVTINITELLPEP